MTNTETKKQIQLELLNALAEQEVIYNAEYVGVKAQLNNTMHKELDALALTLTNDQYRMAYDNNIFGYFNLGFVALKYVNAKKLGQFSAKYTALLGEWADTAALIASLKSKVVMARKPSTSTRKTPTRTLDNTGTCPVCGQNVKLDQGRIVNHGYKVEWQMQQGSCFGTGTLPWEVSSQGAVDYRKVLKSGLAALLVQAEGMKDAVSIPVVLACISCLKSQKAWTPESKMFPLAKANAIRSLEQKQRSMKSTIQYYDAKISDWTAQPLPKGPWSCVIEMEPQGAAA